MKTTIVALALIISSPCFARWVNMNVFIEDAQTSTVCRLSFDEKHLELFKSESRLSEISGCEFGPYEATLLYSTDVDYAELEVVFTRASKKIKKTVLPFTRGIHHTSSFNTFRTDSSEGIEVQFDAWGGN